jgi:hypothetical protein
MQRRDKEMMALSPFLARMNAEWNGPLIDRCFSILWRKSKAMKFGPGAPFPPPPPELSGQALHVEYVSPIALAQRSSENDAIDRLIQRQAALKQMDPESPMILDIDWIMRRTQLDLNAPIGALKSPERLQAEMEAQAKAQQQQQQAEQAQQLGAAANQGSAALKNVQDAQGGAQPPPANMNTPPAPPGATEAAA